MTKLNLSELHTAVEHSAAYMTHTSAKDRKAIRDQVASKFAANGKARWKNMLAAMDAGDMTRINARATGDWAAVKPVAKAPATKAPARSSKAAKPAKTTKPKASDFRSMAAELVASLPTEADRVAFFTALSDLLPKK
jgi:hypothetical protein